MFIPLGKSANSPTANVALAPGAASDGKSFLSSKGLSDRTLCWTSAAATRSVRADWAEAAEVLRPPRLTLHSAAKMNFLQH